MNAAFRTEAPSATDVPFVYHGWQFSLGVEPIASSAFMPRVLWRMQGSRHMTLPAPPESFGSEAMALKQAETQAMRWVCDHMGYAYPERLG